MTIQKEPQEIRQEEFLKAVWSLTKDADENLMVTFKDSAFWVFGSESAITKIASRYAKIDAFCKKIEGCNDSEKLQLFTTKHPLSELSDSDKLSTLRNTLQEAKKYHPDRLSTGYSDSEELHYFRWTVPSRAGKLSMRMPAIQNKNVLARYHGIGFSIGEDNSRYAIVSGTRYTAHISGSGWVMNGRKFENLSDAGAFIVALYQEAVAS